MFPIASFEVIPNLVSRINHLLQIENTGNVDPSRPFIFTFKSAWREGVNTLGFSTIPGDEKTPDLQIFLLKDNKGFLPPKKLLRTSGAKEILHGQELISFYPWYYFVDPVQHLKKYGISKYLKLLPEKEK